MISGQGFFALAAKLRRNQCTLDMLCVLFTRGRRISIQKNRLVGEIGYNHARLSALIEPQSNL